MLCSAHHGRLVPFQLAMQVLLAALDNLHIFRHAVNRTPNILHVVLAGYLLAPASTGQPRAASARVMHKGTCKMTSNESEGTDLPSVVKEK